MRVRAARQGDVSVNGKTQALFPGQVYDLPESATEGQDWLEPVDRPRQSEPVTTMTRKRGS